MKAIPAREGNSLEITLKAIVVYDDFDFAARATALLERVAIRAEEATKWDVRPWRLDVLQQPSLAGAAIAEITDADLVMLALCAARSLPDELMGWLEYWARNRPTGDAAVMVLFPDENTAPTPLWNELKEFAAWHGLPFLGSRSLRDDGDSMDFVRRLRRRRQPVTPVFQPSADRPPALRHWGINE